MNIRLIIGKLVIVLVTLLLLSVLIIESLILIGGRKSKELEVDYVIILGARLYGYRPSQSLIQRLIVATHYLHQYPSTKVVVSGGQGPGESITEASAMKKYLMENGIDESRIIEENKSTNTFQNLKYSLDKIKEVDSNDNFQVLIASNKYHLFRSKLLAKRLGMEAYGLPAPVPPVSKLKSYVREYFAVIKSVLYDK